MTIEINLSIWYTTLQGILQYSISVDKRINIYLTGGFVMNNIELSEKINGYLKGSKTKAKKIKELIAVHFNLLDVSENMYIEVKDGVISVMPYEYNDNKAIVTASTETLDKLFSGAISFDKAISENFVQVEKDVENFKALAALVPSEKKEAAKKETAKKAPAKKPAAKKAEAPKTEKTAPAKKAAPTKKAEAPKAAKKTTTKK